MSIDGKNFYALVADTPMKRMIGLMFRKGIRRNQCMLFIFPRETSASIWMYHMEFRIDAVWLDRNWKVVDMKEDLRPCGSLFGCKTYSPKENAKYLIEFNSNIVKKNMIGYRSKIKVK